jgi:hypothetical protein
MDEAGLSVSSGLNALWSSVKTVTTQIARLKATVSTVSEIEIMRATTGAQQAIDILQYAIMRRSQVYSGLWAYARQFALEAYAPGTHASSGDATLKHIGGLS